MGGTVVARYGYVYVGAGNYVGAATGTVKYVDASESYVAESCYMYKVVRSGYVWTYKSAELSCGP